MTEAKSGLQMCGHQCDAGSPGPRTQEVLSEQVSLLAKCCSDLVQNLFPGGWERGGSVLGRHDVAEGGSDFRVSDTDLAASPWEVISSLWASVSSSAKRLLRCLPHRLAETLLQVFCPSSWHCAWHRVALSEEEHVCISCPWAAAGLCEQRLTA